MDTSISQFANFSKLIAKHIQLNGDSTDISTILASLDIYESLSDVLLLLNYVYSAKLISRIGIGRALFICDELCAPDAVTRIIHGKKRLDNLAENYIINHNIDCESFDNTEIYSVYNNGYKVIPHKTSYSHVGIREKIYLNSETYSCAYDNGLYIPNRPIDVNCTGKNHHFKDATHICIHNNKNINIVAVNMMSCENVKKITICESISSRKISGCGTIQRAFRRLREIDDIYVYNCEDLDLIGVQHNKVRRLTICFDFNNYPKSCTPFAKTLRELNVQFSINGIDDNGIVLCTHLKILRVARNSNITTC